MTMPPTLPEELCLLFANTVHWHASAQPLEIVRTYDELLEWAQHAGALSVPEMAQLGEQAHHAEAAAVWQRAVALREAIYRICVAQIDEHPVAPADLSLLNAELASALAHARLILRGAEFVWDWEHTAQPSRVLWPIVRSAASLLANSELLARVGQCADDRGCGWLFLDLSKNRSRRWCDINDCGNRAKQRRHQARLRQQA